MSQDWWSSNPWLRSRPRRPGGTGPSASAPGGPSSRTCSSAWARLPGSVGRRLLGPPRSRSRPHSGSRRLPPSSEAGRGHVRAGFGAVVEMLKVAHRVDLVVVRGLSVHAHSSVLAGLGIHHVHRMALGLGVTSYGLMSYELLSFNIDHQ